MHPQPTTSEQKQQLSPSVLISASRHEQRQAKDVFCTSCLCSGEEAYSDPQEASDEASCEQPCGTVFVVEEEPELRARAQAGRERPTAAAAADEDAAAAAAADAWEQEQREWGGAKDEKEGQALRIAAADAAASRKQATTLDSK